MIPKSFLFLYITLVIVFSSCSNDDDNLKPSQTQTNVVIVDYSISEPTTWYSDSIYLIPNTVNIEASLTIEAGTIIKFHSEAGLSVSANGTINAVGLVDSVIVFTSIKDDIAGDHNSDLNQTMPNPGDWNNIDLGSQNGSIFKNCVFIYGGSNDSFGALQLGENFSTTEHCLFANNITYVSGNVFYGALAAENASPLCIIEHNTFYSNTVPLSINGHFSISNTNKFSKPDNAAITNTYNGIFVHGQDILSNSPTWEETEVAYVIQYAGFEISNGYSLTLGDNVTIKFMTTGWIKLQSETGLINAQGTGVYFTSYKDDNKKGDTNGDGNTTNPPPANDWLGVYNHNTMTFYTWGNILYSKNANE